MEHYTVTGMSCAACSARVEKAVSAVPGVTSCSVSLLTNSMGVEGSATPDAVISAVQAAGYGASLKGAAQSVPSIAEQEDALAGAVQVPKHGRNVRAGVAQVRHGPVQDRRHPAPVHEDVARTKVAVDKNNGAGGRPRCLQLRKRGKRVPRDALGPELGPAHYALAHAPLGRRKLPIDALVP